MSASILRSSIRRKTLSVIEHVYGRNIRTKNPLVHDNLFYSSSSTLYGSFYSYSIHYPRQQSPSSSTSTTASFSSVPSTTIPSSSTSSPGVSVSSIKEGVITHSTFAHSNSILSSSSSVPTSTSPSGFSSSSSSSASRRRITDGYIRNQEKLKRKEIIDEMLRVDQAGEVGAVQIYAGQMWILKGTPVEETLRRMKEGEEKHVETINRLIAERRVRPTALLPIWEAAGFALGVGTALLGKEAAMACTVAVETAISGHYNDQIRTLLDKNHHLHSPVTVATTTTTTNDNTVTSTKTNEHEEDDKELAEIFRLHRDEELEHHDTALKHDAKSAPLYNILSTVIQVGCSAAIFVAKKI